MPHMPAPVIEKLCVKGVIVSSGKKRFFFTNVFDSGIVEVWFKVVGYTLITTAFFYLSQNGYKSLIPLASLSYIFLVVQCVRGTRAPYEYLKEIYVYPTNNKVASALFYAFFLYIRVIIIFAPWQIIAVTYESGKLPI